MAEIESSANVKDEADFEAGAIEIEGKLGELAKFGATTAPSSTD